MPWIPPQLIGKELGYQIYFDGAGGNVAAGKYNDGSPERRPVLAGRLAAAMKAAWEATKKTPTSKPAASQSKYRLTAQHGGGTRGTPRSKR